MKQNNKEYILFIDSGMGGISILTHYISKKNRENIIYYADNKNFPYGLKEESLISDFLLDIYSYVAKSYKIILIVIACNTASVSALNYLRERIDIPIVGTVPAVKVASEKTQNSNIGIIATETTVRLQYLSNLISQFAKDKNVFVRPSKKLVDAVENNYPKDQIREIVRNEMSYFKENNIDTLVLGCTHYSFLYEEIDDFFEKRVVIVDSKEGVSKRIASILNNNNKKCSDDTHKPETKLILSRGDSETLTKYDRFVSQLKIFDTIIVRE